ncbi:dTDP-4-dehydrorhamnose 3,5-epimerase [Erythrobacter sp.]|uniref:dTDP-4-dehydrorhamnose 3,5-epimerase n=1 Tax=Erythrobacter sp. TaxID=1042 RepID=UPI001425E1A4|nr:dTDP-4-dehydrorhamnose 3,5-epimerase [Erythrobacter sp.]QIQ87524.1 MAG: dTDP-4-dehydrorhamnose 3,5-epimerase [Erythrobacter sp.]
MNIFETAIPGPLIIEPRVFGDARGFCMETWNEGVFREAGLDLAFVQDNHSHSQKGVLRGLHFQKPGAQGKLVRIARGAMFDVAVDLRRSSEHFGRWVGVELTAENKRMFWIPERFAYGFLTLAGDTDSPYECTAPYAPEHEHTLAWDDLAVGIDWPLGGIEPLASDRDRKGHRLADVPAFEGS